MKRVAFCFLAALLTVCCGCFMGRNNRSQVVASAQRRTFGLEVKCGEALCKEPVLGTVKLRAFHALPPFDNKSFIIRRSDNEYAADFYNGWICAPEDLVAVQCRNYMRAANIFAGVVGAEMGTQAKLGLEGTVEEMYLDFSKETEQEAVVTLTLTLVDEGSLDFKVIKMATGKGRAKLAASGYAAASEGYSKALEMALKEAAGRLAEKNE